MYMHHERGGAAGWIGSRRPPNTMAGCQSCCPSHLSLRSARPCPACREWDANIKGTTLLKFHHEYTAFLASDEVREHYIWIPVDGPDIEHAMRPHAACGFPGAIMSMDVVHTPWERCPRGLRSWQVACLASPFLIQWHLRSVTVACAWQSVRSVRSPLSLLRSRTPPAMHNAGGLTGPQPSSPA